MGFECVFCGKPVQPDHPLTYQAVIGWEKPRTQGGANAIALRQPQQRYAHLECVEREKRGLTGQQGMFG